MIVGHHPSLDLATLDRVLRRYKRITQIYVHSTADHDEVIRIGVQTTVQYTRERITSESCCGNVSPRYFSCNLETFTESIRFNSCLHRKIGIDAHGVIRNCPAMPRSYGNVHSTSLASVVATDAFQAPGKTNKDQIAICQDCEFRYVCHDCRVFISDPDQPLSKPSKCRYNPYEGRWE